MVMKDLLKILVYLIMIGVFQAVRAIKFKTNLG